MKRRIVLLGALVSVVLGTVACSGDDQSDGKASSTTESTTSTTAAPSDSSSTTMVSEPRGTDAAAVQPILQALIDRYDSAVAAILADPRVAADPSHPKVSAYLDLFTQRSSFTDGALAFWVREGDNGRFYRPGPRGVLTQSTVAAISEASLDEVTFAICALNSIEITDASGAVIESQGGQTAASVVAVRVDGVWRLRDLTQTSATGCPNPELGA
jgi:hypothetical protein